MKTNWWPLDEFLRCECGEKFTVVETDYNSDAELLFNVICIKCGIQSERKYSIVSLAFRAFKLDIACFIQKEKGNGHKPN